jgi:hypothetical protein
MKNLKFDNPVYRTKEAEDQFVISNSQFQLQSGAASDVSEEQIVY